MSLEDLNKIIHIFGDEDTYLEVVRDEIKVI